MPKGKRLIQPRRKSTITSITKETAMKFIAQYSIPASNPAISEWKEHITTIEAKDIAEANMKLYEKNKHLGCWSLIDLYPAN